jgi:hypothetical protein
VSNADGNHTTPAGWYADPAGSPQLRWWDGSGWTDHLQAPAAQTTGTSSPAPAYSSAPAYASAPSYAAAPAYAYPAGAEPTVPAGTPAYGPFIWVITLLPLITLLMLPLALGTVEDSLRSSLSDMSSYSSSVNPYAGLSTGALLGQLLSQLVSWLIVAAIIVLSFLDYKWLLRTGYVRPFHWAWSFFALIFPPLYVIGRSVVVRRRSGRGIGPLWVSIAIAAVSLIVGIATVVWVFNEVFSMMPSYGNLS